MVGDQLLTVCRQALESASTIFVALSGGLDSTVLLHACVRELPLSKLRAIHVNHGLSANSDRWQRHCEALCRELGVEIECRSVDVIPDGKGTERAARDARYHCFEDLIGPNDCLLLAHHSNDQTETIVYRLLRGAGPKGLQGMPAQRPMGAGRLLRPLLNYTRNELQAYANHHKLDWVEDESNSVTEFDRNYLRHRILPPLATRWPDYQQRILRSAAQCESAQAVLDERGRDDLAQLDLRQERVGTSLALNKFFEQLTPDRKKNLLRCWIDAQSLPPCGHGIIDSVLSDLVSARVDACPLVSWPGGHFRRFRQRLYLLPSGLFSAPPLPLIELEPIQLVAGTSVALPGGFTLSCSAGEGVGALRVKAADRVQIGFRRGGERCRPATRQHSAPLKKLLQEYRLEPWLRPLAPLIYINGELAAVADIFVCGDYECAPDETGTVLLWQFQMTESLVER